MDAIGYLRISKADGTGYGLEAQRAAIEQGCQRKGWRLVGHAVDDGVSGAVPPEQRAGLAVAMAFLRTGQPAHAAPTTNWYPPSRPPASATLPSANDSAATLASPILPPPTLASPDNKARDFRATGIVPPGYVLSRSRNGAAYIRRAKAPKATGKAAAAGRVLVVARLDRLSRRLVDFASLLQQGADTGWGVWSIEPDLDMTSMAGAVVGGVLAVFAQFERQMARQRTLEALAIARQRGKVLGRHVMVPAASVDRLMALIDQGMSMERTARTLEAEGWPTALGKHWHSSTVAQIINRVKRLQAAGQPVSLASRH